jgi:gamma-glutamyl-gamma-aminobutyrate hydrolase PuuD
VQWHPELTAATDPAQQRLFDEFVRFVNERRTP